MCIFSDLSKIAIPFECSTCLKNTEFHLQNVRCVNCQTSVIQIGDKWYELRLHIHQNCDDLKNGTDNLDLNTELIKVEPLQIENEDADGNDEDDNALEKETLVSTNQVFVEDVNVSIVKEENGNSIDKDSAVDNIWFTSEDTEKNFPKCKKTKTVQSGDVLSCNLCDKTFKHKTSLSNHKGTHKHNCVSQCDMCQKWFKKKALLIQHIKQVHLKTLRKRNTVCAVCKTDLLNLTSLDDHMKNVHGDDSDRTPYPCDVCGNKFRRKQLLNLHVKNVHSGAEFPCDLCHKRYKQKSSLYFHKETTHSNEYTRKCNECGKLFKHITLLRQHIKFAHSKTSHKPKKILKLPCKICQTDFSKLTSLDDHIRTVHGDESMFKCGNCEFCTSSAGRLNAHIKKHSEQKQFICNYCGREFMRLNELKQHLNTHTGDRPHICTECGKGFRSQTVLYNHRFLHSGIKRYKCTIGEGCSAAYTYDIDLKRHLFSAHGIYTKKHECSVCSKIFSENKLLKKHMETHNIMSK